MMEKVELINKTATNSGLAKGGLTSFEETFVLGSTVVLRMSISAEFPALRQAENRYLQPYCDSALIKQTT